MPSGSKENGDAEERTESSRRIMKYALGVIAAVVFLPLIFETRFRQLIGLAMLGVFYSSFLIGTWERWQRRVGSVRQTPLGWLWPNWVSRLFLALVPLRAWSVVPFVIQSIVLVLLGTSTWFLGPVIYEVMRNPSTLGLLRDFFERGAPAVLRFLNALATNQDPQAILEANARNIFTSLNRFVAAFLLPLVFIVSSGIGAALYEPFQQLLIRAEGNPDRRYSRILNRYSRLFGEYILFNSIYYLIVGFIIGMGLFGLDLAGVLEFGWKLILGILVTFMAGNLLVPGLGTLVMSALVIGMVYLDQGLLGSALGFLVFAFFFGIDDYLIKPWFLAWVGARTARDWEFSAEVIVVGVLILYAAFGLVGALLLFPILCFTDAYLADQQPELRSWFLHPLQTLGQR